MHRGHHLIHRSIPFEQEFEDTREKSEKSEIFLKLPREEGKQKMLIFHWPVSWGEITDWNYFETPPGKVFRKVNTSTALCGGARFSRTSISRGREYKRESKY